ATAARPTEQLRDMLKSNQLEFLMEAHNGLSAKIVEVLESMSDATSIPILLDGDTGYGNFNNDKLFPKTNSLLEVEEFCGKIKGKQGPGLPGMEFSSDMCVNMKLFVAPPHTLMRELMLFLCTVVIVPTKYYKTPTSEFKVIWANHNLRAALSAMQKTTRTIFEEQSLVNVEPAVAPVKEVFRIQGEDELRVAEKKYLPQN
ncbi:unnamed protein product, partial [Symbiodinium sp. KB8]